jgi:hypothetical protein
MSGNVARLLYLQETGQQLLRVSKSVLESLSTSSVPTQVRSPDSVDLISQWSRFSSHSCAVCMFQIPHAWQEALLAQGNLTNVRVV